MGETFLNQSLALHPTTVEGVGESFSNLWCSIRWHLLGPKCSSKCSSGQWRGLEFLLRCCYERFLHSSIALVAIVITLYGFNSLKRLVTPMFLFIAQSLHFVKK